MASANKNSIIEYETYIPKWSKLLAEKPEISELEKKFGVKINHVHKTMLISRYNREIPNKKMKISHEIKYIHISAKANKLNNFTEYYNLP